MELKYIWNFEFCSLLCLNSARSTPYFSHDGDEGDDDQHVGDEHDHDDDYDEKGEEEEDE